MSSNAALFVGGVVALTLAEYLVHRFVLHGFAPIAHRLHHANPDGAVLAIFFANMDLFRAGLFDRRRRFRCGRANCLCLVFVRASLHASRSRHSLPLSLLKHHQRHHRFASRNYGVSTTLWDHGFRTMLR
jgi:sterol desaturase/sphingolipid hydroxylase (fatty acid hydroxylase superfamily)